MLNIDNNIQIINRAICRHIGEAKGSPRGIISQDILSQLRNFVEHVMLKFYAESKGKGTDILVVC
ncbi:hypothetical protein [Ruminococcus sp.]|uniref:hypothetical protein n=1 Tax=Ruminococcus sp. TaxID=41978 RepID=UPI002585BDD6|nr:hypothetical protein [Ruminococcus sp.]MCR5020898.1 hypothetical protein [Ruminococcus sp.]